MVCTIAKRSAKRLKFFNLTGLLSGKCCFKFPYKPLWGYKKPQHYRPKRARFGHALFNPPTPPPPPPRNRSLEYIVLRPYLPNGTLRFFSYFLAFLLRIRGFELYRRSLVTKCLRGCWPYGHKRCESFIEANT